MEKAILMEDPLVGPIQRQSKKFHEDNFDMNLEHEAYKERKVIERRVNDHTAEIMNIKKKKYEKTNPCTTCYYINIL